MILSICGGPHYSRLTLKRKKDPAEIELSGLIDRAICMLDMLADLYKIVEWRERKRWVRWLSLGGHLV